MDTLDVTREWARRAATHPDLTSRLSRLGTVGDRAVLDHVAEAAHGFVAALVTHAAAAHARRRVWLVSDMPRHRERLAAELELWGHEALVLPETPMANDDGAMADPESAAEWFSVLEVLARADACMVVCAPEAFDAEAPAPAALRECRNAVKPGDMLDPEPFASDLTGHGYERVPTVAMRGQFAVRGGIIDVFPWQAGAPLRIEFFDTEVESVREFDPDSQASTRKLAEADLMLAEPPAEGMVGDYRKPGDVVIVFGEAVDFDGNEDVRVIENAEYPAAELDLSRASHGSPFGVFEAGDFVLNEVRRENFFRQINDWRREGWQVAMVFANAGERERFAELVGGDLERDLGILPLEGELLLGFTFPLLRLAVLSSAELFGRYRSPGAARKSALDKARAARARATLDEIEEGDLVVHYEYGIARYRGVQAGDEGDEMVLEYRDGSLLGVPLEQAHLVGKYVGLGGRTPDLNRLGGSAWKSARKSAEKSILDYAARLLRVQAERQHEPGFPHPPDTRWMWEFERSFHFTETADQRRAIDETKRDLESPRPMDRLICGDVGFGKTEVAIRAAFKAVCSGKQAAILVPTTVLAEQHWRTFRERMSDYPVRVELLNRFRKPSEVRATIEGLRNGSVDIVIGTHRLVSGDVVFKDLGLVVVDEEQRFGVAHKEKFKDLFRKVDVLTLSATPIPRTLYMALMGARDMSTIETPPPNRVPVATTVCGYDERVIRDAIRREMKRGGQVFFLHNRVKTIESMRIRLQELVPEARILVGHGQMEKDALETVMHQFVRGDADVLLATTIIETGIDIPNANTILIDRADRFGLADLYQLRGRVGRAGEKAYAILLLPRDLVTAGDSRKRIHAIKEYTALGSGFKIAMRDLEIRGAGNLLGTKQSGHISQIGFDLYCQLLRQSVERLKGRDGQGPRLDATFKADFLASNPSGEGMISAHLPPDWLAEPRLRITAYRELAEAATVKQVDALEASWSDRFGKLPDAAANLLQIARIKALAGANGIASVEIQSQRLMLHRNGDYILMGDRRFPRLESTDAEAKLSEVIRLLKDF